MSNNLIEQGRQKVEMALEEMEYMRNMHPENRAKKPLKGYNVLGCVSVTPETASAILLLDDLGANIHWCSDGPVCSDEAVIAYLKDEGLSIFAEAKMNDERYAQTLTEACDFENLDNNLLVIDDGSIITDHLVQNNQNTLNHVQFISEQTASGVSHLKTLYDQGKIPCPSHNIDGSPVKNMFDSFYGVRESFISAFNQVSNMHIAGNTVAVWGNGPVGNGLSQAFSKLGAEVFVLETDILRMVQAASSGLRVVDREKALDRAKIHVAATGRDHVIVGEDFINAKKGSIFCNAGHGNKEFDYQWLIENSETKPVNDYVERHSLDTGSHLFSTCKGRLLNFGPGNGCPPKHMSLTFGLHIGGILNFLKNREDYAQPKMYNVPKLVEEQVLRLEFPEIAKKQVIPKTQSYNTPEQSPEQS